jgi:hypothetical protein
VKRWLFTTEFFIDLNYLFNFIIIDFILAIFVFRFVIIAIDITII